MTSGERIIWNIFFDLKELYYRTFLNVDVAQLVGYLASMHKTLSSNLVVPFVVASVFNPSVEEVDGGV